jgi:hypothetical protein
VTWGTQRRCASERRDAPRPRYRRPAISSARPRSGGAAPGIRASPSHATTYELGESVAGPSTDDHQAEWPGLGDAVVWLAGGSRESASHRPRPSATSSCEGGQRRFRDTKLPGLSGSPWGRSDRELRVVPGAGRYLALVTRDNLRRRIMET